MNGPCMSFSFRDSVTLCCVPSPLARIGAGCDRDRVKRGVYLSCLASSWPHFQSCFSGAWWWVSPLWLFLCKGWLLTTHPSQRNDLLSEHDLLLEAETKPFHCQFFSSCDQDKILYAKMLGCHLECHRSGRWWSSVYFLRETPLVCSSSPV